MALPNSDGTHRETGPAPGAWSDMLRCDDVPKQAWPGHKIDLLWKDARPRVKFVDEIFRVDRTSPDPVGPALTLKEADTAVAELHAADPDGFGARYSVDQAGQPTPLGLPGIHLEWAHAQFAALFGYLRWAHVHVWQVQGIPESIARRDLRDVEALQRELLQP
jgi:hypothetical protein